MKIGLSARDLLKGQGIHIDPSMIAECTANQASQSKLAFDHRNSMLAKLPL